MEFSFPKSRRIRKGWEFDNVFRTGTRVNGRLVRMLYLKTDGITSRVGVVAGKRQGSAVFRNRTKRKLREAARRYLPYMERSYLVVISLRPEGFKAKSSEIYRDLGKVLRKSGLLEKNDLNH